jgi:hypothetical protein
MDLFLHLPCMMVISFPGWSAGYRKRRPCRHQRMPDPGRCAVPCRERFPDPDRPRLHLCRLPFPVHGPDRSSDPVPVPVPCRDRDWPQPGFHRLNMPCDQAWCRSRNCHIHRLCLHRRIVTCCAALAGLARGGVRCLRPAIAVMATKAATVKNNLVFMSNCFCYCFL